MKRGKKYQEAAKKVDKTKLYSLQDAAQLVKDCAYAKFNETVEISVFLSLKKSQTVRDTVVLPNQFQAQKKILVFAKGDKAQEALDAVTRLRKLLMPVQLMSVIQILSKKSVQAGWISMSRLQHLT